MKYTFKHTKLKLGQHNENNQEKILTEVEYGCGRIIMLLTLKYQLPERLIFNLNSLSPELLCFSFFS